jgi:hypothetical protein
LSFFREANWLTADGKVCAKQEPNNPSWHMGIMMTAGCKTHAVSFYQFQLRNFSFDSRCHIHFCFQNQMNLLWLCGTFMLKGPPVDVCFCISYITVSWHLTEKVILYSLLIVNTNSL